MNLRGFKSIALCVLLLNGCGNKISTGELHVDRKPIASDQEINNPHQISAEANSDSSKKVQPVETQTPEAIPYIRIAGIRHDTLNIEPIRLDVLGEKYVEVEYVLAAPSVDCDEIKEFNSQSTAQQIVVDPSQVPTGPFKLCVWGKTEKGLRQEKATVVEFYKSDLTCDELSEPGLTETRKIYENDKSEHCHSETQTRQCLSGSWTEWSKSSFQFLSCLTTSVPSPAPTKAHTPIQTEVLPTKTPNFVPTQISTPTPMSTPTAISTKTPTIITTPVSTPTPTPIPTPTFYAPTAIVPTATPTQAPPQTATPTPPPSGKSLLDVTETSTLRASSLTSGVWTTVFQLDVNASTQDVLVIRALNQVTTEDNLVNFSGRILVNGAQHGVTSITTGAQPDGTGGNHHLPISAQSLFSVASSGVTNIKFQIKAEVVSRKTGSNTLDPRPPDTIKYGKLFVERYGSATASSHTAANFFEKRLTGNGTHTPCCIPKTYVAVQALPVSVSNSDILLTSSQIVALHNPEQPRPNILDGEQIASVVLFGSSAVTGYLGENVTRLNPIISVFNESPIQVSTNTSSLTSYVGSNFGNGAYFENASTVLSALKFSKGNDGHALKSQIAQTLPGKTVSQASTTVWEGSVTTQSSQGFVRLSALVNLEFSSSPSTCTVTLSYGSKKINSYKYLSAGYPKGSLRIELPSNASAGAKPKITASCTNSAKISSGEIQVLNYSR